MVIMETITATSPHHSKIRTVITRHLARVRGLHFTKALPSHLLLIKDSLGHLLTRDSQTLLTVINLGQVLQATRTKAVDIIQGTANLRVHHISPVLANQVLLISREVANPVPRTNLEATKVPPISRVAANQVPRIKRVATSQVPRISQVVTNPPPIIHP